MFETEDLLPELADGETGGHDELVITERNTHLRSIPVAGDVGSVKCAERTGTQTSMCTYHRACPRVHQLA